MNRGRTTTNALMVAVFAIVCIVAMEFLAINIGQPNPLAHNYSVKGLFPDADGIPTAADVRVAGVVVGKVTGIAHSTDYPGYTVATMDIQDSRANPIYRNGTATIRPKTLLGEKYVDLVIGDGTSEAIPTGGYMGPGQGTKSVSNDEIFNAFDKDTRAAQQRVLAALDSALQGRSTDVQAILPQLDTVVQNLAPVAKVYERDNATVDSIFTNLDTVMRTLADEHTQLAGFLSNGNVALGAIASRDNSLITTLHEATRVQDELNAAVSPHVIAQQQAIAKMPGTIDSLHAFVDQFIYPQAVCGGRPCGLAEIMTGTLQGQINYPNDQLTVTSHEGEIVTNEWDRMFSNPPNAYKTGNSSTHSALNIVLSEQCDTLQSTLTLPTILGTDLLKLLGPQILTACKGLSGQTATHTGTAGSAATGVALASTAGGTSQ